LAIKLDGVRLWRMAVIGGFPGPTARLLQWEHRLSVSRRRCVALARSAPAGSATVKVLSSIHKLRSHTFRLHLAYEGPAEESPTFAILCSSDSRLAILSLDPWRHALVELLCPRHPSGAGEAARFGRLDDRRRYDGLAYMIAMLGLLNVGVPRNSPCSTVTTTRYWRMAWPPIADRCSMMTTCERAWRPNIERNILALEDLGCQELRARECPVPPAADIRTATAKFE
jgi:hypothetical protein